MGSTLTSIRSSSRDLNTSLTLSCGQTIEVKGRLTGPDGAPVFLVLGGISSNRNVTDHFDIPGWWRNQVGFRKPLDTHSVRILSCNFIADAIKPHATTNDQARAILALADTAGIDKFSAVGASYGGMIALALAALAPTRISRALVISAAHKSSAEARAWRSIQRQTVELALRLGDGPAGLKIARQLAMITYRTPEELEQRFFEPDPDTRDAKGITSYLKSRGEVFAHQLTPERFLAMSYSMDDHNIDVSQIECPITYIAVKEDRLVPVNQIFLASGKTPKGDLQVIHSLFGHDSFLKENAIYADILTKFANR